MIEIECPACNWLIECRGWDFHPQYCHSCGAETEYFIECEPIAPVEQKSGRV